MTERMHIDEWFEQLPEDVVSQTQRLLERVDTMRQTETIYPARENILNAIALTAPANVRVVILGQDPYHGPGQAMGLSFSVPEGQKLPPSLHNIYKGDGRGPWVHSAHQRRPDLLGTAGRPFAQHHAHGARARGKLPCQAGMENAYRRNCAALPTA